MSKQAGQKKKSSGHFIMLDKWLIDSTAWKSLDPSERATYLEFKRRYYGTNNGELALSVRTVADEIHVGKSTASRCIQTLLERGFIELVKASSFHNKVRMAAEYRLTECFCNKTNKPASKAFMKWTKENPRSHLKDSTVPPQVQTSQIRPRKGVHSPMSGTEREVLAS
ncbi:helix-turn-helix domain-containing protein [Ahrensia kielensis]|uniref:helix-turn-helix domain-containing protein n=1 Tax=Ahrensia kielensis TaxID=76980 RepID=UPI000376F747|nr:helix-turn-helix domain-containing protein [Ahrensia kielensis]